MVSYTLLTEARNKHGRKKDIAEPELEYLPSGLNLSGEVEWIVLDLGLLLAPALCSARSEQAPRSKYESTTSTHSLTAWSIVGKGTYPMLCFASSHKPTLEVYTADNKHGSSNIFFPHGRRTENIPT
jgi:hypothetical protein